MRGIETRKSRACKMRDIKEYDPGVNWQMFALYSGIMVAALAALRESGWEVRPDAIAAEDYFSIFELFSLAQGGVCLYYGVVIEPGTGCESVEGREEEKELAFIALSSALKRQFPELLISRNFSRYADNLLTLFKMYSDSMERLSRPGTLTGPEIQAMKQLFAFFRRLQSVARGKQRAAAFGDNPGHFRPAFA